MKKFDVIICTYNGAKRLENVINNILKQENLIDLVSNILVVDNNSNDSTKKIVSKMQSRNRAIKYLFEPSPGLSNARLCGVKNATSEWIIFLDDDNYIYKEWIKQANSFINDNENIGAFNGAVVPFVTEEINNEEEMIMKAFYGSLACTHLNIDDINYNQIDHPNKIPFGAGLVIRTKVLKKLAKEGWLTLKGREKESLSSGEDTEMCQYIKKSGFSLGYNPYMLMKHEIDRSRLNKEYMLKLYKGFAQYQIYKLKNSSAIIKYITIIKFNISYTILFIISLIQSNYELKIKKDCYKSFLSEIVKEIF